MSSPSRFLFTPLKIGSITVSNRIVFSAHLSLCRRFHADRPPRILLERARGGVGLIITEEHSPLIPPIT